jgi:acyl dehydratase
MAHLYLVEHPGAALRSTTTGIEDSIEAAHWDVELARISGMATGYDFGSQRVAWMAHLLTDWCGDDGALVELDVRIRRPNLLGDVTWIDGEVTGIRETDDGRVIDCALRAVNQRGEVSTTATAAVRLP